MFTTFNYGSKGHPTAQVVFDRAFINSAKGREEYREIHEFLTDMFNATEKSVEVPTTTAKHKPHKKSKPHYKVGRKLAKRIIDAGGLKYLHGVHYIDEKQVFYFDKVDVVKEIIDKAAEKSASNQSENMGCDMP